MPATLPVQLTDEQTAAVDRLLEFDRSVQTLGGYAGTGKTTVIRELDEQLPNFAVAAYTGKAANVLRRKGVPATTIHSRIYKPREEEWVDAQGKKHVRVVFDLKRKCELDCDGFIIDEASMVDAAIYADLESFGLPLIFVGDHGQLPPVAGGQFNLIQRPDIVLETVHRNAEHNQVMTKRQKNLKIWRQTPTRR